MGPSRGGSEAKKKRRSTRVYRAVAAAYSGSPVPGTARPLDFFQRAEEHLAHDGQALLVDELHARVERVVADDAAAERLEHDAARARRGQHLRGVVVERDLGAERQPRLGLHHALVLLDRARERLLRRARVRLAAVHLDLELLDLDEPLHDQLLQHVAVARRLRDRADRRDRRGHDALQQRVALLHLLDARVADRGRRRDAVLDLVCERERARPRSSPSERGRERGARSPHLAVALLLRVLPPGS